MNGQENDLLISKEISLFVFLIDILISTCLKKENIVYYQCKKVKF